MNVPPTLNTSWALSTALCFWFLFLHAPVFLFRKESFEPLLYVHLIGVYSVYLACVHNTLLTPSALGGAARPFHVWGGRIGLSLGVVGFVVGFYLTWLVRNPRENLGFSIGITAGGIGQMACEFIGYRSIRRYQTIKGRIEVGDYDDRAELFRLEEERDENLSVHVVSMVNLFVLACGIPALIRLAELIGNAFLVPLVAAMHGLAYFMARPIVTNMNRKRAAERGGGKSEEEELVGHSQD